MKLLFVIERFYPYHDASAKVLKNLLSSTVFQDCEIHVVSIGNNDLNDGFIKIHNISYKENLFNRIKHKIFKGKYIKDNAFVKKFKEKIEDICQNYDISHVIYVIGNMNLLLVNPKISSEQNYVFYDSLLNNFFYNREKNKHIVNIQNNAFDRASRIFLLEEYIDIYKKFHPFQSNKFYPFYITAFYNEKPLNDSESNVLLHAGAFFPGLRDPFLFFDFLNKCSEQKIDISAITLGELPKSLKNYNIPSSLIILNRVFGQEYLNLILSTKCFVLIDNCISCNQIPSKTYEYIGYNRKILFFSEGNTNTAKLLEGNKNVFFVSDVISNDIIKMFKKFLESDNFNERKKYFKNEKDYVANYLLEKLK